MWRSQQSIFQRNLLRNVSDWRIYLGIKLLENFFSLIRYVESGNIGHTFGFHRAEVIAALVSVFTIWILTAFLVNEAIERLKRPQEINARLVRNLGLQ